MTTPNKRTENTSGLIADMRNASVDILLLTAADVVKGKTTGSRVFDPSAESRVPKFSSQMIKVGRVVGKGGFCVVREIQKISALDNSGGEGKNHISKGSVFPKFAKSFSQERKATRGSTGTTSDKEASFDAVMETEKSDRGLTVIPAKTSKGQYVLKKVIELPDSDKITFLKGTVDLAMEAKFLASLDHPNIIKLCGESTQGPFSGGYFVILERMTETLTTRIKKWTDAKRHCEGITGIVARSKKKLQQFSIERRLMSSLDIANGVAYLHSKNIIFRDLVSSGLFFLSMSLELLTKIYG